MRGIPAHPEPPSPGQPRLRAGKGWSQLKPAPPPTTALPPTAANSKRRSRPAIPPRASPPASPACPWTTASPTKPSTWPTASFPPSTALCPAPTSNPWPAICACPTAWSGLSPSSSTSPRPNPPPPGRPILLTYQNQPLAVLDVTEVYPWDKASTAQQVYATADPNHPGVARMLALTDTLAAGKITLVNPPQINPPFDRFWKTPQQLRGASGAARLAIRHRPPNPQRPPRRPPKC